MLLMKCERAIEWANRVLFKSQSKEPMSVAGPVWEGAANPNPQTNEREFFLCQVSEKFYVKLI